MLFFNDIKNDLKIRNHTYHIYDTCKVFLPCAFDDAASSD